MSDIIQDAKKLLEGATPGPWRVCAWERHPDSDVYVADKDLAPVTGDGWIEPADGALIAAAPELAQALAGETWEYSAQYRNDYTNGWKFLEELQGRWCTRETLTLWMEGNLHRFYDNIRIVRRRVSPPEVINE